MVAKLLEFAREFLWLREAKQRVARLPPELLAGVRDENDLPLSLQTSLDNEHFVTIAPKTDPFSAEFPWKSKSKGARGRYVRLISEAPDPRQLFVGEIEVYGR
jgi:hypothetical protein